MTENEKQEHWDRVKSMYLGFINRLEIALGYTPTHSLDDVTVGDLAVTMNHAAIRVERLHEELKELTRAHVALQQSVLEMMDVQYKQGIAAGRMAEEHHQKLKEWDGKGVHPSHDTYISDSSVYDWKCKNCHHTDELGGFGKLAEPCPEEKPWDMPGALPRYNSMGNANYPEYECDCPQHHCDGC